ncbi:patatin-like phospholipase family protein [Nocardia sp. CA-119907]|uniref:patatin-like phospholipase family protein n=1 Tax=Nocardia sp. CA-119907 TaxID=3239973 RepID=UPI003D955FB4
MDSARLEPSLMQVLDQRAGTSSTPDARDDDHQVAIAIEGGGMRGTVSAGMALALHELGLLRLFDRVYGSSAGAISAAWLLSSRPAGLRGWTDPRFAGTLIAARNLLRGRPLVDVQRLIETTYVRDFPLDYASVLANPISIHPLATDVVTGEAADLNPAIVDGKTLRLALRASAALPILAGRPIEIAGRRYYDAGLAESIPFRQALRDGATHVLVLRSRRGVDRAALGAAGLGARLVAAAGLRDCEPELRAAYLARNARLAEDDRLLADLDEVNGASVVSIRPTDTSPKIRRLQSDGSLLDSAFQAGWDAVALEFEQLRITSAR